MSGRDYVKNLNFKELMWGKIMRIPRNQRPYAWEKKHLEQFWNDINCIPDNVNYFMSNIIIKEDETFEDEITNRLDTLKSFTVVDGQQRITTIIILLLIIRKYISNESYKNAIFNDYIISNVEKSNNNNQLNNFHQIYSNGLFGAFRLCLNKDMHPFFASIINCYLNETEISNLDPRIIAHKKIKYACIFLDSKLQQRRSIETDDAISMKLDEIKNGNIGDHSNIEFQDYLKQLLLKVIQRLYFSTYFADKNTNIGILFEASNCRGRQLTNLENIKNKFLYISNIFNDAPITNKIDDTWSYIYTQFNDSGLTDYHNEDQFLHSLWQSTHTTIVATKYNLYDQMCTQFNITVDKNKLLLFMDTYLNLMNTGVTFFCNIYSPFREDSFCNEESSTQVKLRNASIRIHRLGVLGIFIPLLLAANVKDVSLNKSRLLNLMEACEKYVMMVFCISNRKSNTGKPEIARMGGKLYNDQITIEDSICQLRAIARKYCNIGIMKSFFLSRHRNFYEDWAYTKYLLIEYEMHLRRLKTSYTNSKRNINKSPYFNNNNNNSRDSVQDDELNEDLNDFKELTIEHIIPQTYVNCNYWIKHFSSEKICEKYIHRLGNLSICKPNWNASYGSKSFTEKRDSTPYGYSSSELLTERELCKYSVWNPDSVDKRQETIANWAISNWYL